jgi:hypothetical protein
MILLRRDCLVFEAAGGENIPCSAKEVTIELIGDSAKWLNHEAIENAAAAVLHYFRVEMERSSVTVAEFAATLEKVLGGLGFDVKTGDEPAEPALLAPAAVASVRPVIETDLSALAGEGGELFFFPRLRDELRRHLDGTPLVLHFRGLRPCVKTLTGAKRWTAQCRVLNDQIVDYLRTCFSNEQAGAGSALVVL